MKAEEAAYRSGMWLAAAIHNKPWATKWCKENGMPMLARDGDGRVVDLEGFNIRAANENVLSAGGALVPVEMEASIIALRDSYGVMRRLARSRPMNTDQLKIPRRKGGLTAYFFQDDDGVGLTESQKAWDNVTLSTKKLGCLAKVSRDLIEDAVISVVDDLAQEMAYAFAVKEDQCYFIGDGTSTYGGIQGVNPRFEANAYISRNALTSGHNTFAAVDNTDVTTTMGQLAQFADTPEAVFVCSHLAKHQMFSRLKAVAGGNRVDTLGVRPDDQYLGYQIMTSEAMPKVTSSLQNKVMFLFGRFDLASSVGNRRGIEMLTLVERYAELGQIGLIGTERFDLVIHDLGTTSTGDINGGRGPIAAGYGN
jgi:HK97 family phage major capsid protein